MCLSQLKWQTPIKVTPSRDVVPNLKGLILVTSQPGLAFPGSTLEVVMLSSKRP
jgi:hypothetical protein